MRNSLLGFILFGFLFAVLACTKSGASETETPVLNLSAFYGGETAAKKGPTAPDGPGPIASPDQCEINEFITEESSAFMDIVVSRVCTWHYEPVFFPDTLNPILTLETFPRYLDPSAGRTKDYCEDRPAALAKRRPVYTLLNHSIGDYMSSTDPNEAADRYLAQGLAYFLFTDNSACDVPIYRCWNGSGIHFDTGDSSCEGRGSLDGPMGYACARPGEGRTPLVRLRNGAGAYFTSADPTDINFHYGWGWSLDRNLGYVAQLSQSEAETGMVLASKSLLGYDFNSGKYEDYFYVDLPRLQHAFPRSWRQQPLRARLCDDRNHSGSCNLANRYSTVSIADLYLTAEHLPPQIDLEVYSRRFAYNPAYYHDLPAYCDRLVSPLVLNLRGEPIQLRGPEQGVMFDIDATGSPSATGWIAGANDAFLVRDLNHDGRIGSGAELFGSATRLRDGSLAKNGFEALRELDDDQNGVLDARDAAWTTLQLWRDANHNGLTEPGELLGLGEAGLVSIDLNYVAMAEVDSFGNKTLQRSTFSYRAGGKILSSLLVDVWFKSLMSY